MPKSLWVKVAGLPIVINALLWLGCFLPARGRAQDLRSALAIVELKPSLESSVRESDQILQGWKERPSWGEDTSAPGETLQRLAQGQRVQVVNLKSNPAGESVALEAECTGPFNKLARWVSDIEEDSRFQLDSWVFHSGEDSEQPARLSIKMTAFLR